VNNREIRDLDFCSDTVRVLEANARRIRNGTISIVQRSQEKKLLEDLIFFLLDMEGVGSLETRLGCCTYLTVTD
jgi:hypothetical protein